MQTNNSTEPGTTGWFQGNSGVFPAHSGAPAAYIAANYNNHGDANTNNINDANATGSRLSASRLTSPGNTPSGPQPTPSEPPLPSPTPTHAISNWLLTPPLTLRNGAVMTFYTRTVDVPQFPDRLEVRMSTNGASTNVGTAAFDVGDFTTLLLEINPGQTTSGYPTVWTQFTVTVSGLGSPTTGRLAFRYFVVNGGPHFANADYIGLDTVLFVCATPTPTPSPTPTPTPAAGQAGASSRD